MKKTCRSCSRLTAGNFIEIKEAFRSSCRLIIGEFTELMVTFRNCNRHWNTLLIDVISLCMDPARIVQSAVHRLLMLVSGKVFTEARSLYAC